LHRTPRRSESASSEVRGGSAPGLRERKRLARRLEIMQAAAAVFKRNGFDGARIEEIAAQAEVAPGTVYNHFPTKDALLLALATQHRSRTPELVVALVQDPPADPVKAFTAFYSIMTRESMRYLDKVLWRHVHAASTLSGWNQFGSERWSHEGSLIDFQVTLIERLKQLGTIAKHTPARPLAEIIHATAFFWWDRFIAEDPMTRSDYMTNLKRDLSFILARA
jgi:AcrR family transcriptional regulator